MYILTGPRSRLRSNLLHSARQRAEIGDREFLGARGRRDPGAGEERLDRDAERLEARPPHPAALAGRGGGGAVGGMVGGGGGRLAGRDAACRPRGYPWPGDQSARGGIEQTFRVRAAPT